MYPAFNPVSSGLGCRRHRLSGARSVEPRTSWISLRQEAATTWSTTRPGLLPYFFHSGSGLTRVLSAAVRTDTMLDCVASREVVEEEEPGWCDRTSACWE